MAGAVNEAHVIAHGQIVNGAGAVQNTLQQMTNFTYNAGVQTIVNGFDGEPDVSQVLPGFVAPNYGFSTVDIAGALGIAGWGGLPLVDGTAEFKAIFQAVTKGGLRQSGSSHISMLMTEGILIPQSLTVSTDQVAVLQMLAVGTYNGADLPVIVAGSAAYTASASSIVGWTLGPVYLNNIALTGVQSMSIDFGIQLETLGGDGEGYPSFTFIAQRQPSMSFQTKAISDITTITATGKKNLQTAFWLRKMINTGSGSIRDLPAATTHIQILAAGDYASAQSIGGGQGSSVDMGVTVTPEWDGATANIVINTGKAIATE